MTATQALGVLLLFSPIILVTALMVIDGGWRVTALVWAIVAAVGLMAVAGHYLVTGGA